MQEGMAVSIFVIIGIVVVVYIYQLRANARIRKGIRLILKWFDYIVAHPTDFDLETTRTLGEEVDRYLAEKDIGKKVMFFAPKLEAYIADRYGKFPGESDEDAFKRLAHWEGDRVRLDVYWTMILGGFAEYAELLEKGEHPTFAGVSAPIAILRRYWKV